MTGLFKAVGLVQFFVGSVLGSLGHHIATPGTVMEAEATLWYVISLLGVVVYLLVRLVEAAEHKGGEA